MAPDLKPSKAIVKICKDSLDELKAMDICSFEVEKISSFTSFILVASGTSGRHIQSIADKVTENLKNKKIQILGTCLLYTSPSPRDRTRSRMPSSA